MSDIETRSCLQRSKARRRAAKQMTRGPEAQGKMAKGSRRENNDDGSEDRFAAADDGDGDGVQSDDNEAKERR